MTNLGPSTRIGGILEFNIQCRSLFYQTQSWLNKVKLKPLTKNEMSTYRTCFSFLVPGTKLKDFVAAMESSAPIQSEISKLRNDVEEYAKQFPTIGFEKESMKYKN